MNSPTLDRNLLNLNFGTLNLRSLNASNPNRSETLNKLELCIAQRPDILFITETKLCSSDCKQTIEKFLKFHSNGPYNVYFNSNSRSRGVGIIFKSSLNINVISKIAPADENSLILKCKMNDLDIVFAAVYPPSNADYNFFSLLKYNINSTLCRTQVIGGDFNCLTSPLPPPLNIELENHPSLPNPTGSRFISDWILSDNLIDPFRHIFLDKKDFSFEKKIRNVVSKSRIDFFLLSSNFGSLLKDAGYRLMSKSRFDHKYCYFSTLSPRPKPKKPFISNDAILSPEFLRQSKVALVNCLYENSPLPPTELLSNVYESLNLLNAEIISLEKYTSKYHDAFLFEVLTHKVAQFNNKFDTLDLVNNLSNYQFFPSPTNLLRLIFNEFRNCAVNITAMIKKKRHGELKNLQSKLNDAKKASPIDNNLIDTLTDQIETLVEIESNILCRHRSSLRSRLFEKDPKILGSLINNKSNATTDVVKNHDTNSDFENCEQRNIFIHDYYKKLYDGSLKNPSKIDNFFNNGTSTSIPSPNYPTQNDNLSLTLPITLKELSNALSSTKNKNSVGLDLISNQMLQTLYPVIHPILLDAFNFVYQNKGDFPEEFKTSYIRLIPKSNSDLSNIKSWRPITIGSSVYKLYSKVISNRFSKILPKILNKNQKAYLSDRNISELLLNVIETISSSIRSETPMYMISADISKAFDSVNHTFILDTLKFFKFPPTFIGVVKAWLSNRKTCILFPQGQSDFFLISNGVPQGDSLSAYIFILCLEILNLKFNHSSIPRPNIKLPLDTPSLLSEMFADDAYFFIKFNPQNLAVFKSIMNDFYLCSGLALNIKKTKIMIIGSPYSQLDIRDIEDIGFTHAKFTTVLGFHIDEELNNLGQNWVKIINSLAITSNIWSSFTPSITTKIDIIKMFFLSKLSYPASCLSPSPDIVKRIEEIVCKFLFPSKNIFPMTRIFAPIKDGGLNIPNITDFCNAMLSKTAMRALDSDQPWAISLRKHFPNENITLFAKIPNLQRSIIPKLIDKLNATHFNFYRKYFFSAPLFYSLAPLTNDNLVPISPTPALSQSNLINCCVLDIFNFQESRILTSQEINMKFGTIIPYLIYFRLYGGISAFIHNNPPPQLQPRKSILSFFYSKNPSCKKIVNLIPENSVPLTRLTSYCYFNSICPEPFNFRQTSSFLSLWNYRWIPNYIRNFILLRNNNKILLNLQLSKFLDTPPGCTFCSFFPLTTDIPGETPLHLFYECMATKTCTIPYFHQFIDNIEISLKSAFFKGVYEHQPCLNTYLNIEVSLVLQFIYICKMKKKTT